MPTYNWSCTCINVDYALHNIPGAQMPACLPACLPTLPYPTYVCPLIPMSSQFITHEPRQANAQPVPLPRYPPAGPYQG